MFKEFRKFIQRGNVVELAVAFVLGAAFNPIVRSLVDNVIMPPIGLLLGRVDFSELGVVLTYRFNDAYESIGAAMEAGEAVIAYGLFLNTVVSFLITAFAVFVLVRAYNRMQERMELQRKDDDAPAPEEPAGPPRQEVLLEEIRDLLAAGRTSGANGGSATSGSATSGGGTSGSA